MCEGATDPADASFFPAFVCALKVLQDFRYPVSLFFEAKWGKAGLWLASICSRRLAVNVCAVACLQLSRMFGTIPRSDGWGATDAMKLCPAGASLLWLFTFFPLGSSQDLRASGCSFSLPYFSVSADMRSLRLQWA